MKRYEKYKDSGVEWIGEIPDHWQTIKLKYIGETIIGITYTPDDIMELGQGTLVLRSSNIQNGKLDFEDCVFVKKTIKEKHLTRPGDILLCARNGSADLVGKCAMINEENANHTFGAFMTIFRSSVGEFAFQFFNSPIFKSQTGTFATSTINQLTSDTLNNLFVPIPMVEEQTIIAKYLTDKTIQIDKLIANKQQLIELLHEERAAIINQALTKGVNPKVKLKSSGIEWLGDIPKHWEVKKLKYIGLIKYGLGQPPKQKNDGLPLIRATNIEKGKIIEKDLVYVDPEDIPYDRDPVLKEYDIIVVRSGAYTGDSAIVPKKYEGAITGYDMVVRVVEADPTFISFCLLSNYVLINQIYLNKLRAAQPHLNKEELGETLVIMPNLKEQLEIVRYLELEAEKIDLTISKIKTEILLMQEYLTALISEVVTGKIKVV